MAKLRAKTFLRCDLWRMWNTIAFPERYSWRSDLRAVDILSDNRFVEISLSGMKTEYTILAAEPGKRWELEMENENMQGHWTNLFSADGSCTIIELNQEVKAKRPLQSLILPATLHRQHIVLIRDLRQALEEPEFYVE